MLKLACVTVVIVAAGCGGDDGGGGGGTGPLTMAQVEDICSQDCAHQDSCGQIDTANGESIESCTASCLDDIGGGGYRADVVQDIFACIGESCTADDDACFMCTPTSTHESFETACRAKAAECGASQDEIDSTCETTPTGTGDTGFYCVLTPEVITALTACFDMDCTSIGSCFNTVGTQYNLDF